MRRYKIGILGCGVISRTYAADIQTFYKDLEIVACASKNLASAQKLADEFHISKVYSVEELLSDEEVDIVINLTPPQAHVELNKQIIAAGKHLFSEKPFAPTLKEAQEVLALAAQKKVLVGCAPDTFLASGLQSMRYYLDTGMIGQPFFVTANMTTFGPETWHPNPIPFYQKETGPVMDMAPYYLSAIVALLGPIESIGSFCAQPLKERTLYTGPAAGGKIQAETPTHYTAILRLTSGVVVNLNVSFDIYRSSLPMFEIYGSDGTLAYPDPNFGGGTPKIYRKEQFLGTVYQQNEEAQLRKDAFYELPELFPRVKDYSRGIGVLDLAKAIDSGGENRANGTLIQHITEAMEALISVANTDKFYRMTTTCERPRPIIPGGGPADI